ncbi:hypothetical protein H8K35_08270 [Undibacterium sp. LX40W]|uniref:Uncharacterized protein n=1 Tax=Undibacterium nitidum TaxID=2762298 RepID=A0A923HPF3_9BURK|nr:MULTISPECIES: hypothetical protein [Undibacterium]MBC3881571.1 hypothetical protein [Undibacterium nitidum]MBC3891647.1 hypothetical protein [Undibacterium sp. LX40W]
MTAQFAEELHYNGIEMRLFSLPLESSPHYQEYAPKIQCNCTALWRGYIGKWEIVDHSLYLIGIKGETVEGLNIQLSDIFPGCCDRIFAEWYTGKLRVPRGDCMDYVHMGFFSTYEEDLLIFVENGIVKISETISNINPGLPLQ